MVRYAARIIGFFLFGLLLYASGPGFRSQAQLDELLTLAQKGLREISSLQAAFLAKRLLAK